MGGIPPRERSHQRDRKMPSLGRISPACDSPSLLAAILMTVCGSYDHRLHDGAALMVELVPVLGMSPVGATSGHRRRLHGGTGT